MLHLRLLFIAFTASIAWGQPQAKASRSIVRVVLNAAYKNDERQAEAIRFLATRLKPTAIRVRPNDTISATVARLYGLGRSNLDRVYLALEGAIKDLNGITDARRWKPGVRLVPTLPSWAKTDFNPSKVQNQLPAFASAVVQKLSTSHGVVAAIASPPPAPDRPMHAPQSVAIDMEMSESEAEDLLAVRPVDAPGILLQSPLLLSAPMPIVFGQGPPANALMPFSIAEASAARIRTAAARVQRRSLLFIVDSGWPRRETKDQSQRDLFEILKIVREGFRLGPPLVASPDKTWAGGPANPHCSRILDSLRELQGLDDGRAVQVIYVPVSQDQGAQAVLRELLYVYYVWRGLEQNGIRPGQIDLSQRDWKDVRKDAALNASRAISNNVPLKADGANLASDKAILEALLNIATQYCEKTKRSFFVNESWTVGKSLLHVQYPEEPRGIVLAAVGNNAGIDVYQTRWDFARRSLQTNDHIAVMNAIVGDVPACDSNVVGNFTNTRAVAFNGQIAGGPCGTSFAAPRVAWLLAFSEALRPAPVDIQNWANDVQARLVTWLQTGPAGLSKYSFDFDRFANSL